MTRGEQFAAAVSDVLAVFGETDEAAHEICRLASQMIGRHGGRPRTTALALLPSEFEQWWKEYPKKTGKLAARAAWDKASPPFEKCMATLAWQRKSVQWQSGYTPNPATWINQGRWDDEPPTDLRSKGYSEQEIRGMSVAEEFVRDGYRAAGKPLPKELEERWK